MIIQFTGLTKHDLPPDQILEAAMGKLDEVVILGWDKEGQLYFASTKADGPNVLWLMEVAKKELLDICE